GAVQMVMLVFDLLAVIFIIAAGSAWRHRRRVQTGVGLLAAALCLSVGIWGYRALTSEVVAATIKTEPIGPQHFRATVTLPDSSLHMFDLAGDAVYVDAHVLKRRPIGNLLGL